MRERQSLVTGTMMILGVLVLSGLGFSARVAVRCFLPYLLQRLIVGNGIEVAAGEQPPDPAKEGWRNFLEVLAGDQGKFELALGQLEQGAAAAPTDVHNLYTLGRAYFYDAITHNHLASAEKAEHAFARVLELDPKHDALAFHGSVLTILSQGKDLEKFRQGVREMDRMVEQNPDSLTARLSRGLTAQGLPSEARSMMGNHSVEDLEFAGRAFEGIEFHYAPHAEVGSKAFLGESYLLRANVAKAQLSFRAALAVPLPSEPGAKAGRVVLQDIIRKRLNGSEQSLTELLRQAGLGSCNTCHLRHSEAAQSSPKTPQKVAAWVKTSHTSHGMTAAEGELTVNVLGLKSNDEPEARARLRRLLAEHADRIEIVGEAGDGIAAISGIESLTPDLAFLDIEMPGLNGFQLLDSLPRESWPLIVFTTAYDQYAIRAFEVHALDYLLKPVTKDRLGECLSRLEHAPSELSRSRLDLARREHQPLERLLARSGAKQVIVQVQDVIAFQADDKLVFARTPAGRFTLGVTLKELEERLDPEVFCRIHRQTIIQLKHAREIHALAGGHYLLRLSDGSEVEVGRSFSRDFRARFG